METDNAPAGRAGVGTRADFIGVIEQSINQPSCEACAVSKQQKHKEEQGKMRQNNQEVGIEKEAQLGDGEEEEKRTASYVCINTMHWDGRSVPPLSIGGTT